MIRSKVSTRVLSGAFALALVAAACSGSDGQDITAERELEEFNNTTTQAPDPDPTTTLAPTTTTEVVETTTTAATTTTTLAPTEEQQKTEIIVAVEAYAESSSFSPIRKNLFCLMLLRCTGFLCDGNLNYFSKYNELLR